MSKNKNMASTRGFTLIEILVALVIFAVIGVLAAMSLHAMIRTHSMLEKKDGAMTQLQLTMTMMRRDMAQVIDRPIVDSDGSTEAAFVAAGVNQIVFTRTGLQNPMQVSERSNMQRVGYELDGDQLVRITWDVLDQPPRSIPEKQILLHHVVSLQWQLLTDKNQTVSQWPPAVGSNLQMQNTSPLPKAVLMVMQIQYAGAVQGVFPIPARGVMDETTALP
jgi:general secretion pathway protein J